MKKMTITLRRTYEHDDIVVLNVRHVISIKYRANGPNDGLLIVKDMWDEVFRVFDIPNVDADRIIEQFENGVREIARPATAGKDER
jgi:hypothetical protein